MSESINVENKMQSRQKPPLNFGRIACGIFAGMVTGFVIAVPISIAILYVFLCMFLGAPADWPEIGEFGDFGFDILGVIILSFPIVYGPASTIGVYLVGNKGNLAGSLLATVGAGLLGGPVMVLLVVYVLAARDMMLSIEKVILWPLVFIAAPAMAALSFNLTRRYKKQPSS